MRAPLLASSLALGACHDLDALRPREGCGPGLMVCDTFEAATIDPVWTQRAVLGDVTLDTTEVHDGAQSLRIHILRRELPNTEGIAALETVVPFPTATLHARAFVFAPDEDSPDYDLLSIAPASAPWTGITVWREDGTGQINLNEIDTKGNLPGTQLIPRDQWHCLEWELTNLDGATGTTGISRVRVDGGVSIEDTTALTAPTPRFDVFRIGMRSLVPYDEIELTFWLDDVVLDDERIGCDPLDE